MLIGTDGRLLVSKGKNFDPKTFLPAIKTKVLFPAKVHPGQMLLTAENQSAWKKLAVFRRLKPEALFSHATEVKQQ